MKKWYVIQTKPQREKDVRALLNQGGFETFLPFVQEKNYRKGTPFYKVTPLFPSYLFIKTDFSCDRNFHLVKYTRGLNKIVGAKENPISLDDEIIQTIKSRSNEEGLVLPSQALKRGSRICVKKGILKNLLGILETPIDAQGRVLVLLELVNYQMHATLHWSEVEQLHVA